MVQPDRWMWTTAPPLAALPGMLRLVLRSDHSLGHTYLGVNSKISIYLSI